MSLRSWPNSPGLRRYKAIQYVLIFDISIWLKLFYRVLLLEKDLQLRIKTAKRMWLSLIFENNHVAEMYGFRNCWKYLWYSEFLIFFSYILSYFLFFFFFGLDFFFFSKNSHLFFFLFGFFICFLFWCFIFFSILGLGSLLNLSDLHFEDPSWLFLFPLWKGSLQENSSPNIHSILASFRSFRIFSSRF